MIMANTHNTNMLQIYFKDQPSAPEEDKLHSTKNSCLRKHIHRVV